MDHLEEIYGELLGQARELHLRTAFKSVAEWAGADYDAETSAVLQAVNGALALRRGGRTLGDKGLRRLVEVATAA